MTKAFVAVAVVVAVCVLVFTLPEMLLSLKVQTRSKVLLNIKDGNSDRDKLFRKGSVPDRFWGAPAEWNKHKKSLDLFEYLVASDDKAELARLERFCQSKTEYEKVSDGDCRALWSYQLTKQPIVGVGNMLGFWHMTKKGAFQVKFANGMNGWFKPCGGDEEFPENEVIASNLDFLLGFNRASPTVMREISLESLKEILREQSTSVPLMDHRMHILDQTEKICSKDGMLRGAMIGWWYGISDGRSFPKKINRFDEESEVLELRQTSEPRWLAEQVKNHIFWFLIYQIRRPGKNEHVIHTIRDPKVGPEATLLAVDLDRADFTTKRKVKEMSFCFVCKIDRETYKAIKAATEFGGIGSTLRQTLLYDPTGLVRMPRKKARVVDWRLEQVRTCFDECIEKYGADDVLIDL